MNHRQAAPPQPRRIFRGNGGPTDGRLPPKKKKHVAVRHDGTKYGQPTAADADRASSPQPDMDIRNGIEPCEQQVETVNHTQLIVEEPSPFDVELKHLRQRMANHRLSMSLSSSHSLQNYSANALNAAIHIIGEWRAIHRYHSESLGDNDAVVSQTGTLVFELIQQCLQSGPLSGAKPGYFKRCGSDVARVVFVFMEKLEEDIPGLSTAQRETIQKWKANAEKASTKEKLPSKSMLKKLKKQAAT